MTDPEFPEPYIEKSVTMADWLQCFSAIFVFGTVAGAYLLVWG